MKITKKILAEKIIYCLYHQISLDELTDWAENAMMEADLDESDFELLRDILSRLGLADVKAFGMTWEDYENMLNQLGYRVDITISEYA